MKFEKIKKLRNNMRPKGKINLTDTTIGLLG